MKRFVVLCFAFAGMVGFLLAFGGVEKAAAQASVFQGAPGEEYIAVACMGNLEYFSAHKFAWKWMGDKLGVKTSYIGPAEFDVPGQVTALDQAIARRPAGIMVFGVDESLKPGIDKAVDAGIPVVTFSGDVPDSKRSTFVGTNQHDLGYFGGQKIAELLGGKGDVAILSLPGVGMFDAREQGYRDAFSKYPGIRVVQTGDTKADTVTAINTAKAIMQRFPNLTAFACTDSTGGIGSATAVSEAGKMGKVKIISIDRNSDVLEKVKSGFLTGTLAQDDVGEMVWGLLVLFSKRHFDPPLSSNNVKAKVDAAPYNMFLSISWVDKSNVDYFLEANKMYR
ncbi:MAG TPA: substrate-binding domain-containing protein [Spirochaetia bacterium]|nr:substrate-binding domain-containing protein [Spirochaetia bacterium]